MTCTTSIFDSTSFVNHNINLSAIAKPYFKKCTEWHYNAPLAFVISYDKKQYWKRPYDEKTSGEIDASIVATHMMLESTELGIGSTWVNLLDA